MGKAQKSRVLWSAVPHVESALFPERPESLCRHTEAGLYLGMLLVGSFYCRVTSDSLHPINLVTELPTSQIQLEKLMGVQESWVRPSGLGGKREGEGGKRPNWWASLLSQVYCFTLLECKSREVIYCPNHKQTS